MEVAGTNCEPQGNRSRRPRCWRAKCRAGGAVPNDLARGAEKSSFNYRLRLRIGAADGAPTQGENHHLVAVQHGHPQEVDLRQDDAPSRDSPRKPVIGGTSHSSQIRQGYVRRPS